jgi:hypothetical protein
LVDRGKSAARVDWQQAFLLTLVFVFELARQNSAHAFQPLDPNSWPFISRSRSGEGIAIFSGIDYPF